MSAQLEILVAELPDVVFVPVQAVAPNNGERVVYVVLTMDCETSQDDVTSHARRMSASGPADYRESAASIEGYCELAARYGYPVTLLAHPEVAAAHRGLLLQLQADGACLGLHVHPYKLAGGR